MNKNLTEIAYILDRSGSMQPLAEQAVAAFNSFLEDQKSDEGMARLTLVLFDNAYDIPIDGVPLEEVLPLTTANYEPRGSTALLDAIGRTIEDLGKRLEAIPEAERPGSVIFAIFTDGLENASLRFNWTEVSERIKHQREVYKWEFLFLGANQDAIATAAGLNIDERNSSAYVSDGVGIHSSSAAFSRKATAIRRVTSGKASEDEVAFMKVAMSDVVHEEDRKRRDKSGGE